jgi:hypothetical protein
VDRNLKRRTIEAGRAHRKRKSSCERMISTTMIRVDNGKTSWIDSKAI